MVLLFYQRPFKKDNNNLDNQGIGTGGFCNSNIEQGETVNIKHYCRYSKKTVSGHR